MERWQFRRHIPLCAFLSFGLFFVFGIASDAPAENHFFETQTVSDLAYYDGADADEVRHRLDLYLPKEHKDFPVLMFIHGGGWVKGNKNQMGVYSVLARTFTRHGIGVVFPNYRLSPEVQHPEHVRDVARALAWTHKNIARHGGRPDEIFVAGHSAGGHLCALLATDSTYLKEAGLSPGVIRGCMPLSGLFVIPGDRVFDVPFGRNPATRAAASPINHVGPNAPPFLVMFGENDFPACDRPQADAFCKECQKCGVSAELMEIPRRNHISILLNMVSDTDPVPRSMLSFITAQVALQRLQERGAAGIDVLGDAIARYAAK
jgi:acetyl esterase/lipase